MHRAEIRSIALGTALLAGLFMASAIAATRQIPAGTSIPVTLETTVSSATNRGRLLTPGTKNPL
jgi:hypothetical protein